MNAPTESSGPFTRREALLLFGVCVAVLLTRLPWLAAGFGADADSYRVVLAARHIAETGQYVASRLPGYPAHEYLIAITSAWKSPGWSNGLTASFSVIACWFLALILRHFRIGPYLLLAAGFAMTSVVYVNSVNSMDYMFALAMVLGSTYFVLVHRPVAAGVCLGLAIGFRMTSGAMLLPLALWMFLEDRTAASGKRFLKFSATALLVGGSCFVPVLRRYGLDMFSFYGSLGSPTWDALYWVWVLGVWGELAALGLVGLCVLVPFIRQRIRDSLRQIHVRRGLALSFSVVALYFVAFLCLPRESAYLMPVVPFLLLAIGLVIPPHLVRCLAVLLLLSSFFSIGNQMGVTLFGPIRMDHWTRESRIRETGKVLERVAGLPGPSVIVAGWNQPQILASSGVLSDRHEVVTLIEDLESYQAYVDRGRTVYFLPGMDAYNLETYGIDLPALGAQPLNASDPK